MAQARWSARSSRSRASAANGPVSSSTTAAPDSVAWRTTASHCSGPSGMGVTRRVAGASASATACRRRRRSGPAATTTRSAPVPGPDSHSTPAGSSGSNPRSPLSHHSTVGETVMETEDHGASAGGVRSEARRNPLAGPTARRASVAGLNSWARLHAVIRRWVTSSFR